MVTRPRLDPSESKSTTDSHNSEVNVANDGLSTISEEKVRLQVVKVDRPYFRFFYCYDNGAMGEKKCCRGDFILDGKTCKVGRIVRIGKKTVDLKLIALQEGDGGRLLSMSMADAALAFIHQHKPHLTIDSVWVFPESKNILSNNKPDFIPSI